MVATSKRSLQSIVASISTKKSKQLFRKTRNSVIPDVLDPPYEIKRGSAMIEGLWHSIAIPTGCSDEWSTCCRLRHRSLAHHEQRVATCLSCGTCMGCWCCMPGYITDETMNMGKWETKDGRELYPFEMDNTHLMNAIAKLQRDKSHFKDDWQSWVKTHSYEARLRRLV